MWQGTRVRHHSIPYMKIISSKFVLAFVTAIAVLPVSAKEETASPAFKALSTVASPELPAKAIEMVTSAKAEEQSAVTVDVVKTAVRLRPTMATAVVSALASKSPANAAIAAATAITAQPKQARLITRSAVSAAPSKVKEIVRVSSKANPTVYDEIVMGASAAAPTSSSEILEGLTEALPNLKPGIDRVIAGYNDIVPSVAAVMDQVKNSPTTVATSSSPTPARGPSIGAPYIPLSGTPTNAPGGTTVNPGSRDYARP